MPERFDIFISYRRDGGFATANHLYDLLSQDGFVVSFDTHNLREGDFDVALLERIDQCTDFILIVDKHAFDRTLDPGQDSSQDWMRTELAHALKHNKNIIPVLLNGVSGFPPDLPEDIANVATKNGPEYNKYYFEEFYKRLKTFLHSRPSKKRATHHRQRLLVTTIITLAVLLLAGSFYFLHDKFSGNEEITRLVTDSICINPVQGEFRYTGPIDANGQPHGKGLAKFAQGDTYEGEFVHGTFEGECTYLNHAEGDRFMGTYKNNNRDHGTYVWNDGTYFTGTFKNNEVYEGTLYDINGNVIQELSPSE
jgi:hypothetical protein